MFLSNERALLGPTNYEHSGILDMPLGPPPPYKPPPARQYQDPGIDEIPSETDDESKEELEQENISPPSLLAGVSFKKAPALKEAPKAQWRSRPPPAKMAAQKP